MKKSFSIITVLITISLIGIIAIQYSWLKNVAAIRKDQISGKVDMVEFEVVEALVEEKMQYTPQLPVDVLPKGAQEQLLEIIGPQTIAERFSVADIQQKFEKAFEAFCFKCGHISHKGQDCRIYPDQTAFLTLCSKCRQGLHDECKSRRKFYPKQNVNQLQSYFQRDGFRNFCPPYPMWGGFNNGTMPYGDFGHLGQSERPRLQPITED